MFIFANDILKAAARAQAAWNAFYASLGNEPKTTFYGDLTIAEMFGPDEVRHMVETTFATYGKNLVYITEFVVCLNHKISAWYGRDNELAELYNELWIKSDERLYELYAGNKEALSYIFEITD